MRIAFFLLALFSSAFAIAHTPVCQCKLNGEQVVCEGGYHDGSEAVDVAMSVNTYDGEVLASGKLDKQSRFSFTLPAKPFYVLMDAGPGEMFEVDWTDIYSIDKRRFYSK